MPATAVPELKSEYVSDIPWEDSPAFFLHLDNRIYLEAFKLILDSDPDEENKISFDSNTWDFNPFMDRINNDRNKILFESLPEMLIKPCKFFALYKISDNTRVSTIHQLVQIFSDVIKNIFSSTIHKSIHTITTEDIHNEIKRRNRATSTEVGLYDSMFQICNFLARYYKLEMSVDLDALYKLYVDAVKRTESEDSKTPDIPAEYFDIILDKATSVMRDKDIDTSMRMMAAAIVLLSQTGLRVSDFLGLSVNALYTERRPKSDIKVSFIHYASQKPSKPNQPLREFNVISNDLADEAFEIMKELREESTIKEKGDFLFVLPKLTPKTSERMPHSSNYFGRYYKMFFWRFLNDEIRIKWEGIKPTKFAWLTKEPAPDKLYVPTITQFRVHFATFLYNSNVKITFIERYLGHISTMVRGYYIRAKDTYQENIQFSEQMINAMVNENAKLLGGDSHGDDIAKSVIKFVKDNNINVNDLDAIIEALGDKMAIRAKEAGVCIKTSLLPCGEDPTSDSILCATNLCPHLYSFFFMADVSYCDFQTAQKTYTAMIDRGQARAAEKELEKIKAIVERRLIPQLEELNREIERKGVKTILESHPSLIDIIEDRQEIMEEAEIWRSKQ